MVAQFNAFLQSAEGIAFWGLFSLAMVDFAVGTFYAWSKQTFQLDLVGTWLRSHLMGRVAPVSVLLIAGFFLNQPALSAIGGLAAATYLAETLGSIRESFSSPEPDVPEG